MDRVRAATPDLGESIGVRGVAPRGIVSRPRLERLLGAQLRMHRYGEARRQHTICARRMAELAIPPVPLAATIDARP